VQLIDIEGLEKENDDDDDDDDDIQSIDKLFQRFVRTALYQEL
jgi:hypothetical protein